MLLRRVLLTLLADRVSSVSLVAVVLGTKKELRAGRNSHKIMA